MQQPLQNPPREVGCEQEEIDNSTIESNYTQIRTSTLSLDGP